MAKQPIISQPQQRQQQQQHTTQQQQSPLEASALKRSFDVAAPKTNEKQDMEMSPRKRVRKQQLMTKNDAGFSSANPGSSPLILSSVTGFVPIGAQSGVSGFGFRPLQGFSVLSPTRSSHLELQADRLSESSQNDLSRSRNATLGTSRQLLFQPSLPTAPVNPSHNESVQNGTKEATEAETVWAGVGPQAGIPPLIAAQFETAKGEESSASSVGDEEEDEEEVRDKKQVLKKPHISLLSFYPCNWKTRQNHFQSYAEIKVKEEKKLSLSELANQRHVNQRASGWRLYSMSAQLENVVDDVVDIQKQLVDLQKALVPASIVEKKKQKDHPLADVNDLFECNLQRCKVVKNRTEEAKDALIKILDHKTTTLDIISKHHRKRPIKHQQPGL